MNLKSRIKNPYFWTGLIALFISTVGLNPSELVTWELLYEAVKDVVLNPFLTCSFVVAAMGVILDPSSEGLKDKK